MSLAAIAAIASIAGTAASTGISLSQAAKQKKLQREADAAAVKAIADVRKRFDVNVYEALGIPKEVYELEREALLQQGALVLQAGMEGSQRGAAATAGRAMLAQQQGQAGVRTKMAKDISDLERMTAIEEARLRDLEMQLNKEEAEGAQQASAEAAQARQLSLQRTAAGVQQLGQQALMLAPLFPQNRQAQQAAMAAMDLSPEQVEQIFPDQDPDFRFDELGGYSRREFRQFLNELSPAQQQLIYTNPQYQENYNPFSVFGGVNPLETYYKNLAMMGGLNNQNNQGN